MIMAKALVIKDVNFYSNRLTTVNFADIPCTGISLAQSTKSIVETGTASLIATTTPQNTTDPIIWSSSDTSVATVNGGSVTAIKKGTAVITATCGMYSATCTVIVTSAEFFAFGKLVIAGTAGASNFSGFASLANASGDRGLAVGYSVGKGYPAIGTNVYDEVEGFADLYPYPIPEGTKKIKVSCPNFGILFVFFDSKTQAIIPSSAYGRPAAQVVDGETTTAGTQWSIGNWTYDTRTIDVPDIQGLDSFVVSLYGKNDTAYNNFDPDDVTIEFLTE